MTNTTLLPIRESAFPETLPGVDEVDHTKALLQKDIPGFVIRHAGDVNISTEQAIAIQRTNVARIASILKDLHDGKEVKLDELKLDALSQARIGTLHHDIIEDSEGRPSTESRLEVLVHGTLTGGGNFLAAQQGSGKYHDFYDEDRYGPLASASHLLDNTHPDNLLLQGKTNPSLMSPDVYSASVGPGDSVVVAGGVDGAWHRADTDQSKGTRAAIITKLVDPTHQGFQITK